MAQCILPHGDAGKSVGTFPIARNDPVYAYDTNSNSITAQQLEFNIPLIRSIVPVLFGNTSANV